MAEPESTGSSNVVDADQHLVEDAKTVPDDSQASVDLPSLHGDGIKSEEITSIATTSAPAILAEVLDTGPSLYCPKNGRSHAGLLDFNITSCTVCKADLSQPKSVPVTNTEDENNTNPDPNKVSSIEKVKQTVHYRDREGELLVTKDGEGGRFKKPMQETEESDTSELILQSVINLRGNFLRILLSYEERYGDSFLAKKYKWTQFGISLQIYSKAIITAIGTVAPHLKEVLDVIPLQLNEPYSILGHHYTALKQYAIELQSSTKGEQPVGGTQDSTNDARTKEHMDTLFKWLDDLDYEKQMQEEAEKNQRGFCTFRMLWTLLKPGTTVCMDSQGLTSGYVIESVRTENSRRKDDDSSDKDSEPGILTGDGLEAMQYTITVWNLRYDGKFVSRCRTDAIIPYFPGEKAILSLNIIPLDILEHLGKASSNFNSKKWPSKADLERWGRKWYKSLRGDQVYYRGPSLSRGNRRIEGRAYIDPSSGQSVSRVGYDPVNAFGEVDKLDFTRSTRPICTDTRKCHCKQCSGVGVHRSQDDLWHGYDLLDPTTTDTLENSCGPHDSNHRYLVCDRTILGLVLKTRSWEILDIAGCSKPEWNKKALDALVMPVEQKKMVQALVDRYNGNRSEKSDSNWCADIVEGKGEGIIILLHGGPGVGKTFTAECIAEFTCRPLISLTCADIGTDENKIEENLNQWLLNAERSGAVLLIDEADVYMETRRNSDLERNSLVSVFLRCLEYYRGILFLTTNRVGQLDDAFMSRIHVVIKYEPLSEADQRTVWSNFFLKLENDRPKLIVNEAAQEYAVGDDDGALCKQQWNGREIRNAFQTAIALAEYRARTEKESKVTLRKSDLQSVFKMTREFKQYLVDVHGAEEAERAYLQRVRAHPSTHSVMYPGTYPDMYSGPHPDILPNAHPGPHPGIYPNTHPGIRPGTYSNSHPDNR